MVSVNALIRLATGDDDRLGVSDNDVVSQIFGLVVDGFVFAHEEGSDVDGEGAKDAVFG